MKTNDITVCAFPKSGITYLGFLLAAARLKHNGIDLRPTFYNIDWLLIDTHKFNAAFPPVPMWHDGLGEFYKTHSLVHQFSAEQGPPMLFNVVYLLRNPVDTLASYFHFRRQLGATESCAEFLNGPEGIKAWNAHVRSWLIENRNPSQSLYLLEYEDLLRYPFQELASLTQQLGLSLSTQTLTYAVDMAEIKHMREAELTFAGRNLVYARFNLEFVRPNDEHRPSPEMTDDLVELIQRETRSLYDAARGLT